MTRNEKGLYRLLTEPYVSKTTIRDAFRCGNDQAQEIFDTCKQIEKERCIIDPRPNQVQAQTVLRVTNLNYSFIKKQFENLQEMKKGNELNA